MPLDQRMSKDKIAFARQMRHNPTASEAALWHVLRGRRQKVKFRRQACMLGYIADFYCHQHRLVLELDGSSHNNRSEYDLRRDKAMTSHGITVLRIDASRVFTDMPGVLADIAKAINQRVVLGFALTIADPGVARPRRRTKQYQ